MFKKQDRESRRNLKKRVISILLSATLALLPLLGNLAGLYPVTVSYSDGPIEIDQSNISMYFISSDSIRSGSFKLVGNIAFPGGTGELQNHFAVNGETTIDLNGHTITAPAGGGTVNVNSDGILTITGSSGSMSCMIQNQGGTVNINGGSVSSIRMISGTVNISGGTVGSVTLNGGTLNQSGGTITSLSVNSGTYTQTGGTNPNNFTITLDPQGGTTATTSVTTITTSNGQCLATVPAAPTAVDTYHTFDGWYTTADGDIQVDTSTVFTSASTIYAHWTDNTPATYTINYDANGGSVTPTSGTTGANGKLASLPTPTWAGHTCTGWFTDATGGTEVDTNTEFNSDDTIYAHWEETASTGPAQAPVVVVNTPERTDEIVPEAPIINPPKQENKNEGDESATPERSYWETNYNIIVNFLNNLKKSGKLGAAGQSYVIKLTEGNSLDLKTLEFLKKYPFLTIDYQFIYKGKKMRALIPGALVFTSPTIKYYGPEWLYAYYGVTEKGTPVGLFYLVPDLAMQLIK